MKEKTKVFELSGKRWQVGKVDALSGSNIIRRFTASKLPNPQAFLGNLSDEDFITIQRILFSQLFEIQVINNNETLIPVLLPSGTVSAAVSEDASLVYMLTVISLSFNLSSFFAGDALTQLEEFTGVLSNINALNQ